MIAESVNWKKFESGARKFRLDFECLHFGGTVNFFVPAECWKSDVETRDQQKIMTSLCQYVYYLLFE